MIFQSGHMCPTLEQLKHAHKHADESFCVGASELFMTNVPCFDGYEPSDKAVLLRLKNVEPHDDPWVSHGNEPRVRRAIFWLLADNPSQIKGFHQLVVPNVWFGTGKDSVRMKRGDYVVFDDSKKHWVMSDRIWRGASWQLTKIKEITA